MPVYVILALAAAICFSLNAITSKLVSKYSVKSVAVFVAYLYLLNIPFLPVLGVVTKIVDPAVAIIPLVLYSTALFIGSLFIITALYRFDVSMLHPFFHFQTIFSVGLAYMILGERYPFSTYGWVFLIIIGGILVGMNEKFSPKALLSKSFGLFLIGVFFYAWSDIFAKQVLAHMNVYNLKFWASILLLIPTVFLVVRAGRSLILRPRHLAGFFITNAFGFVGTMFLYSAFVYNITISQPIGMFGSLFTLVISIILSRIKPEFLEHASGKVYAIRAIGVALMIFSVIMIARV